jgi:hypothetical protein
MKKKDWFIIGGVLLLALVAFFASRLFTKEKSSEMVTIYIGSEVYQTIAADDYQTITIDQGDGKVNVIVIDESGVRMESSTCKNQICVHHATIDPHTTDDLLLDRWIVCLPNAVSIEVSGAEDGQ